jgi:hypothetical protein
VTSKEKQYWRIVAALTQLFDADEDFVETNPAVKEAVYAMARLIQKFRDEESQRCKVAMRTQILKEMGIRHIKKV